MAFKGCAVKTSIVNSVLNVKNPIAFSLSSTIVGFYIHFLIFVYPYPPPKKSIKSEIQMRQIEIKIIIVHCKVFETKLLSTIIKNSEREFRVQPEGREEK